MDDEENEINPCEPEFDRFKAEASPGGSHRLSQGDVRYPERRGNPILEFRMDLDTVLYDETAWISLGIAKRMEQIDRAALMRSLDKLEHLFVDNFYALGICLEEALEFSSISHLKDR